MRQPILAFLMAAALPTVAGAAELSVLSAGAVEPGLTAFARWIRADAGHDLAIRFSTAPQIAKRLDANEVYDILIAPPATIDRAIEQGRVDAATRVPVGRVGVGIVVRRGAPMPETGTPDALKRTVEAADAIVYNTASTGLYLDSLFARMGIADAIRAKATRYPDGASVMEHLLKGSGGREIGFGAITEIRMYEPKGLTLVGPLPAEVQNYTRYEAVMMKDARNADVARDALKRMAMPEAKAAFASGGVE